jgi:hypothetical protein
LDKRQKTFSLEERKKKMNTLFGLRPWKPHVTKRPLKERSPEVKTLYIEPTTVKADVGMIGSIFVTLTLVLIKRSKINSSR